jgi:hypothetical protein
MIGRIFWQKILGFILVSFIFTSVSYAQGFEIYGVRKASDILPTGLRSGPHFKVREDVVSFDYLHHYTVDSDYGTYKVTGDIGLRKLVREIYAIAALKNTKTAEAVGQSVKHGAKAPFRLAKDLVTNPVDTVSGLPKGVSQITENITEGITMTHDPSEDARIKQALFVSSWKRDFAAEHNVDVYSSNKVLQRELNRVGWASALTSIGISVATASGGAGVKVFKSARLSNQVGNVLKEEPPSRLRLINQDKLKKIGIPQALIDRFLDHPSISPRHDTIITECLVQLGNAKGREKFLSYTLTARDEVAANFFQQMAEILRGYDEKVSPLTEIHVVGGMIVAQSKAGAALIPFPLDHGVWRPRAAAIFDRLVTEYRSTGFNNAFDLWVTGTVSDLVRQQLAARNIRVAENVGQNIGLMD